MADAPEGHHRQLLVLGQARPPSLIGRGVAGIGDGHGDLSEGQHVAVGIVAGSGDVLPCVSLVEDGVDSAPGVPEVVHHSPHVGVGQTFVGILVLCLSGA